MNIANLNELVAICNEKRLKQIKSKSPEISEQKSNEEIKLE